MFLYANTLHAGWAYDSISWLRTVRNTSFAEHLNFSTHNGLSHYQLTQLIIWTLHWFFSDSDAAYFLVHIALQALNTTLLYRICLQLFRPGDGPSDWKPALSAAMLFCLSPSAGEVIVYKAAFHYGFSMAMLLGSCALCLSFLERHRLRTAWLEVLLYALSLFSLELSYLTPFWCLALILWKYVRTGTDRRSLRRALLAISLPQFVLLAALQLTNLATSTAAGASLFRRPLPFFAIKPPLFLLHLSWGRFLPQSWRDAWLKLFCSYGMAAAFYAALMIVVIFAVLRFRNAAALSRAATVALAWILPATGLSALMWFPEKDFIYCDRYLFPMLPAAAVLIACGIASLREVALRRTLGAGALLLSIGCSAFNNRLWRQGAHVVDGLLRSAPEASCGGRALLLNCPWSFRGAPMIFAGTEAGISAIDTQRYGTRVPVPVHEVMSYNMHSTRDGARARVLDDSTLLVTLDGPGAWVRAYDAARSYETERYRADIISPRQYRLRLRDTAVCIWLQRGDRLKQVDPRIRDRDQL